MPVALCIVSKGAGEKVQGCQGKASQHPSGGSGSLFGKCRHSLSAADNKEGINHLATGLYNLGVKDMLPKSKAGKSLRREVKEEEKRPIRL